MIPPHVQCGEGCKYRVVEPLTREGRHGLKEGAEERRNYVARAIQDQEKEEKKLREDQEEEEAESSINSEGEKEGGNKE